MAKKKDCIQVEAINDLKTSNAINESSLKMIQKELEEIKQEQRNTNEEIKNTNKEMRDTRIYLEKAIQSIEENKADKTLVRDSFKNTDDSVKSAFIEINSIKKSISIKDMKFFYWMLGIAGTIILGLLGLLGWTLRFIVGTLT